MIMYLDPKKYRFRSTITGRLQLQVKVGAWGSATTWKDAKVTDLMGIPENQPIVAHVYGNPLGQRPNKE